MTSQADKQVSLPSRFARAALIRGALALAAIGFLLASGCRSVPLRQSHGEMETMATAALPGIEHLPRHSPRDSETDTKIEELLADNLTVENAVRIALANNHRIQAEYERLDMAAAERLAARLLKNPQAEGSVIVSEEDSSQEVIDLGAEIDLLHMILLPKRSRIGAAKHEATKIDVARAVQKLAFDTRIAYYRLLAARQRLEMRSSAAQAAEATREMAERLREAGNIKQLDKLNREALHEQAGLGVSAAELAEAEAREKLNVLMGVSGDNISWRVAAELPQPSDDKQETEAVVSSALQNSVQLAMTRWNIDAAAQSLGIAKVESVIPSLHVGIDAEREPDGVWHGGPMVVVELPLFDVGQARRPAAEAELRRLRHDYAAQAVEIAAAARIAAKRAAVSANRAQRYREKLVPLRRQITRRTQLQYNAMQLGVFQLLQAKQMEIGTESAYIEELLNYWIARIELEQIRKGLLVDMGRTAPTPTETPMTGGGNGGH
ncbi:MAG: TolC family protein [Verrucomicrobiota bacterium]